MISTPLEWRELNAGPERWTMLTVPGRLKRLKIDPWAGYWTAKQQVTRARRQHFAAPEGIRLTMLIFSATIEA
jgi:DNA primase